MDFGTSEVAKQLLEIALMRIGVAVEAQEIDRGGRSVGYTRGQRRTIGIFVGIEEDVGAVVFVVTE